MRRPKVKSANELKAQVIVWNHENRIGTEVEYHPVIGEPGHRVRKTGSIAYVLSEHTAVVMLEGESGCVALDACVPVKGVRNAG